MIRKNCRQANPRSFSEAIDLSLKHAESKHRRSVDRVAELANENSKWTIYDWSRNGSIPGRKILAFQHACGCDLITRYLAHSAGKMLIDMPHGHLLDAEDVHQLQATLNQAVGALLGFADGKLDADQVTAELNQAMEALAWHRENVIKFIEPELEFDHG